MMKIGRRIGGAVAGPMIALGAALALTIPIILLGTSQPGQALRAFLWGPWSSPWFLGNTLDAVALLLTASLGAALAFRGGCFNLGGEGQIYLGGLTASVVILQGEGLLGSAPGPVASAGILLLAGLGAVLAGGAMGAVSALLKKGLGASELISSFLLSAALTPAADFLISSPLRDKSGNLLATPRFAPAFLLPRLLPPSHLSASCLCALALALLGHLGINRTGAGYRFKIAAAAPDFARFGGIEGKDYLLPALGLSGSLGGLTGFFAVAGTYGICHIGFPGGLGWNAIAVALIARNEPLFLLPAALIYGWLKAGSDAAMLSAGLRIETAGFIQAAVLIFATLRFKRTVHA